MANMFIKYVDLIGAQVRVQMTASRGGALGRVMIEVFPYPFEGNAPGMVSRYMLHWKQATKLAMALKVAGEHIRDGVDVVPGTNYSPVMFYLGQGGEFDPGIRVVINADECDTWMHIILDAAKFAAREPGIVVAHNAR
jgi:hypothetical protein